MIRFEDPDFFQDGNHEVSSYLLKQLIEPRIEAAACKFDHASLEVNADAGYAKLSFLSHRLMTRLYLAFWVRVDAEARTVWLQAKSCLRPYSFMDEPVSSLAISIDRPDYRKAEFFVEKNIVEFLKRYLRQTRSVPAEAVPESVA